MTERHTKSSLAEDKVFSVQTTNVRLSGNIKTLVVDSDNFYLESIDSTPYLNSSKFKLAKVTPENGYINSVCNFTKRFDKQKDLYAVKQVGESANTMANFKEDIYEWGAYKCIGDLTKKSHRFFAPIWTNGAIPDFFMIYRLSPGTDRTTLQSTLLDATLVSMFDMSESSALGKYLRTLVSDYNFSKHLLNVDLSKHIAYTGISAEKCSIVTLKESSVESYLANERTITEFNNAIANGWYRNNLLAHNLLNLEFAFDDFSSVGFHEYVGFYMSKGKEVEFGDSLLGDSELTFSKLVEKTHSVYDGTYSSYERIHSVRDIVNSSGYELRSIAQIKVNTIPPKNSVIKVLYEDSEELNVVITPQEIKGTVGATAFAIAEKINELSRNTPRISIRSYVYDTDILVIECNIVSELLENISLRVPDSMKVIKPTKIDGTSYANDFFGVFSRDIIIDYGLERTEQIKIATIGEYRYTVAHIHKYKNLHIVRLDRRIADRASGSVKFYSSVNPILNVLTYIKHKEFDTDTYESAYVNNIDYDAKQYRNYLLSAADILSVPNVQEYKDLINKFFGTINSTSSPIEKDNASMLIAGIDTASLEATKTVENEYDRLSENSLPEIKGLNRIVQFIPKFGLSVGSDATLSPYSLNISMAFRTNNFAPSLKKVARDLKQFTHSWFIIGTEAPEYVEDKDALLSYVDSITPLLGRTYLTKADFINSDFNPYDYFTVKESHDDKELVHKGYSVVERKPGSDGSYTMFRGIEYHFENNFEDYKFAAVLLTREQRTAQNSRDYIELIENREHQTLTLVIYLFMSSQIMTDMQGYLKYTVDRMLLYYMGASLTTGDFIVTDTNVLYPISLEIGETYRKIGNNEPVNCFEYIDGKPFIKVYAGDTNRFNTPLTSIVKTPATPEEVVVFKWKQVKFEEDGTATPKFTITAYKVRSVTENYFLCEDIVVKFEGSGGELGSLMDYVNDADGERYKIHYTYEQSGVNYDVEGLSLLNEFFEEIKSFTVLPANMPANNIINISDIQENNETISRNFYTLQTESPYYNEYLTPRLRNQYKTGSLFDKDTVWYAVKSLSYYNAYYDENTSSQAPIGKYSIAASGAVANILNNYQINCTIVKETGDILLNDDLGESFPVKVNMVHPYSTYIISSISAEDDTLVRTQKIGYPISRQRGFYSPVFYTLHAPYAKHGMQQVCMGKTYERIEFVKVITNSDNQLNDNINRRMQKILHSPKSTQYYVFYDSFSSSYMRHDVLTTPLPCRGFVSLVHLYYNEFEVTLATNNFKFSSIIEQPVMTSIYPLSIVSRNSDFDKTTAKNISTIHSNLKNDVSKVLYDSVSIVSSFFSDAYFGKRYSIKLITDSTGKKVKFNNINGDVSITEGVAPFTVKISSIS